MTGPDSEGLHAEATRCDGEHPYHPETGKPCQLSPGHEDVAHRDDRGNEWWEPDLSAPVVPSVGAVPVEVPEEARRAWWAKAGIVTDWDASGNVVSVAFSIAALREHEVRVRAEERQRVAEGLDEFVVDDPEIGRDYGFNAGLQQARWVITSGFAAGSAVPVATPGPVEVASLSLDDLPDWTELAEATGATLHNSEIGCSGEYETTMRWPDGRTAGNRDRLAIISADSELPSIAEQVTAYRQVEAEYAAERAARLPVATPTEPDPPEGAQRKPDRPDSFCNHTVEEGCTGHGDF